MIQSWEFPNDYVENLELIHTLYTDIYPTLGYEDGQTKDDLDLECACAILNILWYGYNSYMDWIDALSNGDVVYLSPPTEEQLEIIVYLITIIVCNNLEQKGVLKIDWSK